MPRLGTGSAVGVGRCDRINAGGAVNAGGAINAGVGDGARIALGRVGIWRGDGRVRAACGRDVAHGVVIAAGIGRQGGCECAVFEKFSHRKRVERRAC